MKYNRKIIYVMVCVCALFISLAVYLTYFELFEADTVIKSTYNRRIWEEENSVLRGSITDRYGTILAYSETDGDSQKRIYPYSSRYTHVIGYNSRTYGKTGLELKYNDILKTNDTLTSISDAITGNDSQAKGANLRLTLDNVMTQKAESLMKGKNGAVVALVPKTGEVLCLYSNPTFDPNESALTEEWADLAERDDSPFLGRATSGLYAPGSTFKTITAAAAIASGYGSYTVDDNGSYTIDGYTVKNYGGHSYGQLDIQKGFAKSSNVMFASLAVMMGQERMLKMAESFGIGQQIPFDITVKESQLNYSGKMNDPELAALGIGQGKLLVTPFNMALVAAAIANNGVIMTPYVVEEASYDSGRSVYRAKQNVWKTAVSSSVASQVGELMKECVASGTGTSAKISGVTVAGKTGTAENEKSGSEHAWFICYAPAENPEIAVCVMQEYSGTTGSSCAPIARELIKYYLGK
jgi:peptidoglycan glycosyltransferase